MTARLTFNGLPPESFGYNHNLTTEPWDIESDCELLSMTGEPIDVSDQLIGGPCL
jgi:hypothetical protein